MGVHWDGFGSGKAFLGWELSRVGGIMISVENWY